MYWMFWVLTNTKWSSFSTYSIRILDNFKQGASELKKESLVPVRIIIFVFSVNFIFL